MLQQLLMNTYLIWGNKNTTPFFEEFKLSMNERLTNQETLLLRIAQELGLDKPKQ